MGDIHSDLDRRVSETVDEWSDELEEAEIADVLERWLDNRCASDWF